MKRILFFIALITLSLKGFSQGTIAATGDLQPTGPYAMLQPQFIKGQTQFVADTFARNSIPNYLRIDGQFSYTTNTKQLWQLQGGTSNGYWKIYQSGLSLSQVQFKIDSLSAVYAPIIGSNSYIRNTSTYQTNAQFNVNSGTLRQINLLGGNNRIGFYDPTNTYSVQISANSLSSGYNAYFPDKTGNQIFVMQSDLTSYLTSETDPIYTANGTPKTRQIINGYGITGGHNFATDITIATDTGLIAPKSYVNNFLSKLTAASTYEVLSNKVTSLDNSTFHYPSSSAVTAAIAAIPAPNLNSVTTAGNTTSNGISVASLVISGTTGSGINLTSQPGTHATPSSGQDVYADASGRFSLMGANGFALSISKSPYTASHVVYFPDVTDTLVNAARLRAYQSYVSTTYVPQSRTLTGGIGMLTIGDLSTNRTINVDTSSTGMATKGYTNNFSTKVFSAATYVPLTRTLTAGRGIFTIGDLSANRTIGLDTTQNYTWLKTQTIKNTLPQFALTETVNNYSAIFGLDPTINNLYITNQIIQAGGQGGAAILNGTNQYLAQLITTGSTTGTISFWFRTTSTGIGTLFHLRGSSIGTSLQFTLSNGRICVLANAGGQGTYPGVQLSSTQYNDGKWHYFVHSNISIANNQTYVDNVQIDAGHAMSITPTAISIYIGASSGSSSATNNPSAGTYLAIEFDQFMIYAGTAFSSAQVNTMWNSGFGVSAPIITNIFRRWDFDNSSTIGLDGSSNSSNLTAFNTPTYDANGKVGLVGTVQIGNPFSYTDGVNNSELGRLLIGDPQGGTIIRGKTIGVFINNTYPLIGGIDGHFVADPSQMTPTPVAGSYNPYAIWLFGAGSANVGQTQYATQSTAVMPSANTFGAHWWDATGRMNVVNSSTTTAQYQYIGDPQKAPIVSKSANYTITLSDYTILVDASGGNVTISTPPPATSGGYVWNVKKIDSSANTVTLSTVLNGGTIDNATTSVLTTQNQSNTIQCNATNFYKL